MNWHAAGVLITEPRGNMLLCHRWDGTWSVPGGERDEDDESPEYTASRELLEETGFFVAPGFLERIFELDGYVLFTVRIDEAFEPRLCEEHDDWGYYELKNLPVPLHPGMAKALSALNQEGFGH